MDLGTQMPTPCSLPARGDSPNFTYLNFSQPCAGYGAGVNPVRLRFVPGLLEAEVVSPVPAPAVAAYNERYNRMCVPVNEKGEQVKAPKARKTREGSEPAPVEDRAMKSPPRGKGKED